MVVHKDHDGSYRYISTEHIFQVVDELFITVCKKEIDFFSCKK
jgi:hypothetical protein